MTRRAERAGRVVTRVAILDEVCDGETDLRSNAIDVHVAKLRAKVDRPFGRESIQTVRGVGFRLADEPTGLRPVHLRRLPLHARLVAGFAGAMLVVLVAAGGFVWWRVEYALDHRFDQDLASRTSDLQQAARRAAPAQALASLRDQGRLGQLVAADRTILASGAGLVGNGGLLTPAQARQAAQHQLKTGRGYAGQLRICAPGHHHRRPTTSPDLAAVPCEHPESGTTLTLLWPVAQR